MSSGTNKNGHVLRGGGGGGRAKFSPLPIMGTAASGGGGGNKAAVSSCSSSPWIFHSIMAGAQIAFIAFVTILCDLTKRIPGRGPLYFGHLIPASVVVYLGVYNMHIPLHQPWYKTMIQEGVVAIAFGCFYITAEFVTNDWELHPWSLFGHWGDHIMMSFWIMVFGYMSLVVGQTRAVNFSKIPILIITVALVMFIGVHPQTHKIGYFIHYSSAFWAALGGVTKLFGSNHPSSSSHLLVVAGVCYIQSGYLFFAGQMKMIMWADDPNHLVIPSSYLLIWHIVGSTVSALYMTNILRGDNRSLVIVDHSSSSDYGCGVVQENHPEETMTLLDEEDDEDEKGEV